MDNPQRQWLHHAAHTHYARHLPDRVFRDVDLLLSRYPTCLFPKLDTYVHPDGVTSRILCLYGTIPVVFGGASYNIPVEIWIPEPYPSNAPIVYVRPTQGMAINPSKDVDANGRVFHSVLHYWDHRSSELVGAVAAMQHAFSLDPPVYAKPPAGTTPAATTTASPTSGPGPHRAATPTVAQPYPQPVPLPHPQNPHAGSLMPSTQPHPQQPPASPTSLLHLAPPPTLPPPMDPHAIALAKLKAQVTEQLGPKLSLTSSALMSELDTLLHEDKILSDHLIQVQNALAMAQLEAAEVDEQVALTRAMVDDTRKVCEEWEAMPEPGPDDVLVFTGAEASVQAQLVDAVADDHAIEDVLYALGKALDEGKCDIGTYLKSVRGLAKDQFLARLVVRKCAERLSAESDGGGRG